MYDVDVEVAKRDVAVVEVFAVGVADRAEGAKKFARSCGGGGRDSAAAAGCGVRARLMWEQRRQAAGRRRRAARLA